IDPGVGGGARLHHDHYPTRTLQGGHESLGAVRRHEGPLVAELLDQRFGPLHRPVVEDHRVPVPGEVPGQVATHHRQAGHPDLRGLSHDLVPSVITRRSVYMATTTNPLHLLRRRLATWISASPRDQAPGDPRPDRAAHVTPTRYPARRLPATAAAHALHLVAN